VLAWAEAWAEAWVLAWAAWAEAWVLAWAEAVLVVTLAVAQILGVEMVQDAEAVLAAASLTSAAGRVATVKKQPTSM